MRRAPVLLVSLLLLVVLGACAGPGSPAAGTTLAKIDGWREDAWPEDAFETLELAFDRSTAERLWAENVPDDLPPADGVPLGTGVYGSLADVDLTTSVVALWSSGQSGSCPAWVRSVRLVDGVVVVDDDQDGDECTADFNAYRLVLVLDRDDVPGVADLPAGVAVGAGDARPARARAYE